MIISYKIITMRNIVILFSLTYLNYSHGQESIYPQFNLNTLIPFPPGSNIEEIPKKWGTGVDITIREPRR